MRIALLLVATLAIAAASVSETTFTEEVAADVPHTHHVAKPKAAKTANTDFLLQEEREQMFHEASTRVQMVGLLQSDSAAKKKGSLSCTTTSAGSNRAGVVRASTRGGYTMTGGGMVNNYRSWNKLSGFEEMFPNGNYWQCDTGFGWGDYTVYVRGCKAPKGHNLSCITRHSGVGNYNRVKCPSGYQVTGCGINNHYRHWNHLSGFE